MVGSDIYSPFRRHVMMVASRVAPFLRMLADTHQRLHLSYGHPARVVRLRGAAPSDLRLLLVV